MANFMLSTGNALRKINADHVEITKEGAAIFHQKPNKGAGVDGGVVAAFAPGRWSSIIKVGHDTHEE